MIRLASDELERPRHRRGPMPPLHVTTSSTSLAARRGGAARRQRRPEPDARRVSRRARLRLRRGAARHLARGRRRRAAGDLASARRARIRHPRLRRVGGRGRRRLRRRRWRRSRRAARARFVHDDDALQAAPADGLPHLRAHAARDDHLHQRHDRAAQGRRRRTHANIGAQIASLVEAWGWRRRIGCCSCCRCTTCTASSTASAARSPSAPRARSCRRSTPTRVWERLASGEITVFTAVPTIYHRLIAAWDAAPPADRRARSAGVRRPAPDDVGLGGAAGARCWNGGARSAGTRCSSATA